jgi:hypothetical protein
MIDHLTDTNVFSEIFKGNADIKTFVEGFENSVDTTVYVECLPGSKGNQEKIIIKKYLSRFSVFITHPTFQSAQSHLSTNIPTHMAYYYPMRKSPPFVWNMI